jgi:molecular chaperone DnaK (HSP70)
MAMTYHRNMVAATFRALHPDTLEISEQELEEFDETLVDTFDEQMRAQARDFGIDPNKFNLSMLVFFSAQSTASLVKTRVRHGCRFFASVRPQP